MNKEKRCSSTLISVCVRVDNLTDEFEITSVSLRYFAPSYIDHLSCNSAIVKSSLTYGLYKTNG